MALLSHPLTWVLIVAVLYGLAGLRWVPEGHIYTVHRRGRFHRSLGPGLHAVVPLLDRISHRVSMLGRVLDLHDLELVTKDAQPVRAEGVVYFQVLDARKAERRLSDLDEATRQLAASNVAEMLAQMDFSAINERSGPELNSWLLGMMNQSAGQWGVRVTRVDLDYKDARPEP
jgi:regulator of protease activity HflC (stomatin/prohibitin superfamily)